MQKYNIKKHDEIIKKMPRPYLSWSQLNMWEKDPNLYYQVYFEGLDQFRTKYLELGTRMATALENGFDAENDPMMEMMLIYMPTYQIKEFDIKENFEDIPLFGKLDGFDVNNLIVGEYKSGKKWTQSMVDNHSQLTFYAFLVWLKYKVLPKQIFLHWAQTYEDENGILKLTGHIQTFQTERKLKDIILLSKRIKIAWKGIQELAQTFN